MPNILVIESSPRGAQSITRQVTANVVAKLKKQHPGAKVTERDLSARPLPHLEDITINAYYTPAETRSDALKQAVKLSDETVDELLANDIVVIGAPMWNFGIPSVLKAWIDHITRAGRTFRFGAAGPEGLVTNKKAIVVVAAGGVYASGPAAQMDNVTPYLRTILNFIGITDITFIRAEGIAKGEAAVKDALAQADAASEDAVKHAA